MSKMITMVEINSYGRIVTREMTEEQWLDELDALCRNELATQTKAANDQANKGVGRAGSQYNIASDSASLQGDLVDSELKTLNVIQTQTGAVVGLVKIAATVGTDGVAGVLTSSGADLANGNPTGAALSLFTGSAGGIAKLNAEAGNAGSLVSQYGDNAIKVTDTLGNVSEAAEGAEVVPITDLTADQLDTVYANFDSLQTTTLAQGAVGAYDQALTGMAPPDRAKVKEDLKNLIKAKRAEEAKLEAYGAAILHREDVKTANEDAVGSCVRDKVTPIPRD